MFTLTIFLHSPQKLPNPKTSDFPWEQNERLSSVKQGNLVQFVTRNIEIREKGYLQTPKSFTYAHKHHQDPF